MPEVFDFHAGDSPLLISVPHDGRRLDAGMAERMTAAGRAMPDTDWHVAELYAFARDLGASVIVATYSRYVIDLNRPGDDAALYAGQLATGLCPTETFAGEPLYLDGQEPEASEKARRLSAYWQPYHRHIEVTLDAIRDRFGYALLWDAHSIPSVVPRLFEGELALLNLGSNDGRSAALPIVEAVSAAVDAGLGLVLDGRFRGGHITRHFGRPTAGIHALQLEIAQRGYMDEASRAFDDERAAELRRVIRRMLAAMLDSARGMYA